MLDRLRISPRTTGRFFSRHILLSALLITLAITALHAQNRLSLDPSHSEVHFTLGDTLHVVHGTFHLQQETSPSTPPPAEPPVPSSSTHSAAKAETPCATTA